jgi:hypothetical protein
VAGASVNLSWNASSGATQYWLWARRVSDNVVIFNQNVGNITSYTLTDLPNNGKDYFWMVRAGNSKGWSKWTTARRFINGGASCTYSISSSSGFFTSSGGTNSVLITASNPSCTWTASESLDWVTLSPTSGTGNGMVEITTTAYTGGARNASITIAGQTYTISQANVVGTTDDRPTVIAAANALATGNIPLFNTYLSCSMPGIGSVPLAKAKAIANAFKNAKRISEDGLGMRTWQLTYNGQIITFCTILEGGEWKLL